MLYDNQKTHQSFFNDMLINVNPVDYPYHLYRISDITYRTEDGKKVVHPVYDHVIEL